LIIQTALTNRLSPHQLQRIMGERKDLQSTAYERTVTIMFIDIAGYSRFAEDKSAEVVFSVLRSMFGDISQIVYEHGGIINNTLGDGILALFGYSYDGKASSLDHAD